MAPAPGLLMCTLDSQVSDLFGTMTSAIGRPASSVARGRSTWDVIGKPMYCFPSFRPGKYPA